MFAVGCYGGLSCGGSFAGLGWYGRWCWDLVPSGGDLGLAWVCVVDLLLLGGLGFGF